MKDLKFLLVITATVCLAACHKDNIRLTGKWKEVKLRAYSQDKTTGAITHDTTYQVGSFGDLDYAQFSGDTCTISHNLSQFGQLIQKHSYIRTGRGYALTQTYINLGNIDMLPTMDTVTNVTGNSLIVHSVVLTTNVPVNITTVFDAYYSK